MAYPQTRFASTTVTPDSLVGRRRQAVAKNTLLYQLEVLKKTGRYDAFKLHWHPTYDEPPELWPIPNHLFWDSDVAKWIEGACYLLKQQHLLEVDEAVKDLVEMIRFAQQPDGYLNLHYTVVEPGKRFTSLRDMHELYNAGHMIEAALAHNDFYGDDLLLGPVVKYADLLCDVFGPSDKQLHGYPGHPEIELALLRLHDRTGNSKHADLARYFLTERGNPQGCEGRHYYVVEAEKRGDDPHKQPAFYPEPTSLWYHQAHKPIQDQESVEGHSVRAMYLLTAVADLVRLDHLDNDHHLRQALIQLWENMTQRKMYVTGGIGAIEQWEGFGIDYFLPQGTDEGGCYSETCAAIGVMMLSDRILQIERDAKFADVMELCLYNAVLTAMSYDGKSFTYVNELASSEADLSKRSDWFTIACCPPNILRLLAQIGGYIWNYSLDEASRSVNVTVNLYVPSTLQLPVGTEQAEVTQNSRWPWDGEISFKILPASTRFSLRLRIPGWASSHKLTPACPSAIVDRGYLVLSEDWLAANPTFTLSIPLKPRWIVQHPFTGHNTVSLARGPVVYCVEDFDNTWVQDHFKSTFVDPKAKLLETLVHDEKTGDELVNLTLENGARSLAAGDVRPAPSMTVDELESVMKASDTIPTLTFVPYYFRANRGGRGQMRVGFRKWP